MSQPHIDDDLHTRLEHLENRIEALHSRLSTSTKSGGGIGCLGFALFVLLFLKLDQVLDAVQALAP
ncbi:MAG: hypothetical protein ACI80K_004470 [Paracoccaceae bacterium]|jgi:hypothetical protein